MPCDKPKLKICGITNTADALRSAQWGADALGFIFAASPRRVTADMVIAITRQLEPFMTKVGVFVNEEAGLVNDLATRCGLDVIQLHGGESPEYCQQIQRPVIKVLRPQSKHNFTGLSAYDPFVSAYLFDTWDPDQAGGTGRTFPWDWLTGFEFTKPWILSGGVSVENLPTILKETRPYAIDVNSSLESAPGQKDQEKIARFMKTFHDYYLDRVLSARAPLKTQPNRQKERQNTPNACQ